MEMFTDPFLQKIMGRALTVGILVSLCASLLGVSLVLKRYSMIGDGLSHVGFGAMAIAAALDMSGQYSLEISIPIVVVAAFFLLRLSENSKIKGDAAIALVSTSAMAIGVIIYDKTTGMTTDICGSLFGQANTLSITDKDLILSVILSLAVIILFIVFYNRIFAITFDETFAKATGVRSGVYNLVIAFLTAITIVLGMRLLGAMMISSLIIFPPLSAMRLCKSFKSVVISSAVISVVCFVLGFFAAASFDLQTGPCVIVVNLICLIMFSIAGKIAGRKKA